MKRVTLALVLAALLAGCPAEDEDAWREVPSGEPERRVPQEPEREVP